MSAIDNSVVVRATLIVLLASCGCARDVAIERPMGAPARLVNQIPSLASPTDIKQRPEFSGTNWVVVEDSRTQKPSKSTQFDNYAMSAANYAVGSVHGSLRMEFVNGMLFATWFYPSVYQLCLEELAATGLTFPSNASPSGSQAVTSGDTTIRLGKDYEGRRYVAWEDRRLVDAMNKWLMRNS